MADSLVRTPARRAELRSASTRSWVARRLGVYGYVAPVVIVSAAVMGYPFVYSVYLSFRSTPSYSMTSTFAGLSNYAHLLHEPVFGRSLVTTAIWTISSTVLDVALGLASALLLVRVRVFGGLVRAAIMLPYIVGYVVASYAWLWLYQGEYGLISQLLVSWHITDHPVNLLSSLQLALPAVILVNVWKTFPFAMIMLLAGLQGVPEQTVLAARLDRASAWKIFWEVKLVYIRPVLAISTMLLAIQNFNTFTIPYIMTHGGPRNRTQIVSNYIYNLAFTNLDFGSAAAGSIIVTIILMAFAIFYLRTAAREDERA